MSNPNPKQNPFHSEDWFVETIKLDPQVQNSKINALNQFKSKYHPKISTVSKLHHSYTDFVAFLTSNLIFSSFLTIVVLSTFGVSASEILAPREYKPSTFLFAKGYSNSNNSTQQSSSNNSSTSTSYSSVSTIYLSSNNSSKSVVAISSSTKSLSSNISSKSTVSSSNSESTKSSINSSPKQIFRLVPADYNEVTSSSNSTISSTSSLNISLQPAAEK
jgi:hypothetical protein